MTVDAYGVVLRKANHGHGVSSRSAGCDGAPCEASQGIRGAHGYLTFFNTTMGTPLSEPERPWVAFARCAIIGPLLPILHFLVPPMQPTVTVKIEALPSAEGLPLPQYETESAAGLDLRAAVDEPVTLQPGRRFAMPTGLKIALPVGYEAQVRPRSGLAFKHGIALVNAPGTIDADYRGEVRVLLINLGEEPFTVSRGDRIAQLVVAPVTRIEWEPVETVDTTARGTGGFGSTGVQ